jgi:hypothetical protein
MVTAAYSSTQYPGGQPAQGYTRWTLRSGHAGGCLVRSLYTLWQGFTSVKVYIYAIH